MGATSLLPHQRAAYLLVLALFGLAPQGALGRKLTPEQLLNEGLAALEKKEYATAQTLFSDAYVKAPNAKLLFQLGLVALGQDKLIEAQDYMRRFIADPSTDEASTEVKQAAEILNKPHGPSSEVDVQGDVGALLRVDGRVIGILPLTQSMLLSADAHTLRLEQGKKSITGPLTIRDGRGAAVQFSFASNALVVSLPPSLLLVMDVAVLPVEVRRKALLDTQQNIRRSSLAVSDLDAALKANPGLDAYLRDFEQKPGLTLRSNIDYVLSIRATSQDGAKSCSLKMELRDPSVPQPAAAAERKLRSCVAAQVLAALGTSLGTLLLEGSTRARGPLNLTSAPVGAEVRSGDWLIGKTPLALTLWAGHYELDLSIEGYQKSTQSIEITESKTKDSTPDKTKPLVVTLEKIAEPPAPPPPPPPPPPPRRPLWPLAVGGAAIGLGGVLIGLGSAAVAIDGTCTDPPAGSMLECRTLHATQTPGAVSLSIGMVLFAGGAVLLVLPPKPAAR